MRTPPLILLTALAVTSPALAQNRASKAPSPVPMRTNVADSTRHALAMDLARTLNPEAQVVGALSGDNYIESLRQGLLREDVFRVLEEEHPGIARYMIDKGLPILLDYLRSLLPALWSDIAGVYVRRLSEAEIQQTLTFFRTPTGTKMVRLVNENVSFDAIVTESVNNRPITADTLDSTVTQAAKRARAEFSAAETAQIVVFMLSPTGRKLKMLQLELSAVMVNFANHKPSPEIEARMGEAFIAGMNEFLAPKT